MWTTLLFGALACVFSVMTGGILLSLRKVRRLPGWVELDAEKGEAFGCSIVIAARDEESRIAQCLERLLAQSGVDLEVIVVNDRSCDRTGEILEAFSKRDTRVRAITVEELPANWLGKCHACHLGANAATREWILFTDADCWLAPDVLERALRLARREKADHVTLTPGVRGETILTRAWHLAFIMTLADWMAGVNGDVAKRYLGLGAFNLVRSDAYRACGGYEALRMTVLDDVKLGLLIRRAGKRTRAFLGGADVECHWGSTLGELVKVMEKNYFAAVEYRTAPALIVGIGGPLFWAATLMGAVVGGRFGWTAFAALWTLAIPAAICARRLGWGVAAALLVPLMYPVLFYAILNSTMKTLRQGGVRWRETFYPLEALRRGTVR
jgi:glycosyltransferase involved in cell wall biosynthesis